MSTDESEVVTLKVRVTPSFREQIQQAAKENNRSMNAEIVLRLEQSFLDPMSFDPNDAKMVTKLVAESMSYLLTELSEQGVEGGKLVRAVQRVAKSNRE